MNMDVTPILFSLVLGISFLQETYPCQLARSFLLVSVHAFIYYKQIKFAIDCINDQENISNTVIYHVKKLCSLSKYHASNIDSIQIPLILNEELKEEEKEDDELHQSGCISPTPSLSTASTTSSASFEYRGKVGQLIYLFESGQLFDFHAKEKQPFIMDRRFDYDPTSTEWQKRTLIMKSKFI